MVKKLLQKSYRKFKKITSGFTCIIGGILCIALGIFELREDKDNNLNVLNVFKNVVSKKNKFNIKHIGLIVAIIPTIIISYYSFTTIIDFISNYNEYSAYYGSGSVLLALGGTIVDIIVIPLAFLLSLTNISGPIVYFTYLATFGIICMIQGISFSASVLILSIGYAIILIHYIIENNKKKEALKTSTEFLNK